MHLPTADEHRIHWRKSTHSGGGSGNCVEVADNLSTVIAIRDSKNPDGGHFVLGPSAWTALAGRIKGGEFDL